MYIFDWDTLEWHNEDVSLLSFGNKGSRAHHVIEKGIYFSVDYLFVQMCTIEK